MTHLSEQEIIEIIDKIASRLGPKFKFGYHTNEDMKQQASLLKVVLVMQIIGKWKPLQK